MIYFDNSATGGRKPQNVVSAVTSAVRLCSNPGRSGHKLSLATASVVLETRTSLSDFFDGYGFDRVVFTKNCTEALNLAIFGLLKKGDHVVTTAMEHNSVLRPLEKLKNDGVIDYDVCPVENGNITANNIQNLLKPNTKAVIITSASNVTGSIPPLQEISEILPENVLFICDGAQGGGHYPISMKKLRLDALALAGHKGLHGIQGSGVLLFSDRVSPTPILYGGTGSVSTSLNMPDFYPDRLEAGTLNFPSIASLNEGLNYLRIHQKSIAKDLMKMTEYLIGEIDKIKGYKTYSVPNPCGIVAFEKVGVQSEFLAEILSDRYSFAVRGGYHCAPLMHKALKTDENGLIRVSFSEFNSMREIDDFIFALKDVEKTVL